MSNITTYTKLGKRKMPRAAAEMTIVKHWPLLLFLTLIFAPAHHTVSAECNPQLSMQVTIVPWSLKTCETPFSTASVSSCFLACFSRRSCLGANFLVANSTLSNPISCSLCPSLYVSGAGEEGSDTSFIMPYKYRAAWGASSLAAPSGRYVNILIYITAVPMDQFTLAIHQHSCDASFSSCSVEIFCKVTLVSDQDGGPRIELDKKFGERWSGPKKRHSVNGIFESGREFKMLLLVLFEDYVVIVDGVEVFTYPVYGVIKPILKFSTSGLEHSSRIIMYQTDET
ncbi:hypothetical protein PoB_000238600 [Plakobranchus ocellatus]|uniref:Galectin n=1 Tax=Plakobranchus ocellatus TaxID=259542 RepID=A0AAV3Y0N2_9GAST|nr:hypothetical protein PoB_000238600 [Plakobranchus ocellatus]